MARLRTHVDPSSETWRANDAAMRALVQELRAKTADPDRPRRGRRRPLDRPPPRARQAARPRAHRPAARPRRAVPRAERPGRERPVRRRCTGRRHRDRHRRGQRHRVRHRRQRRHGQGRHLLPADGQEAPAGAGDRAREPPPLPLPGRLRRRLPAAPGRGLPRPRPLRPHLLQPGAHERRRHPADRPGHGLVHRRRRVRAGDERRDGHRPRHRHHLPGRPAAGPGSDR